MAKMFYTAKEAAERLGRSEDDVKALAREGKLREFRDAGSVNYKVGDVDALAAAKSAPPKPSAPKPAPKPMPAAVSGSQSGEIVLEPVDDSSVALAPSSSDVVSLEGVDAEDTAAGARVAKRAKEGSSIPSVGVNVFDDDELDEHVDPLAQTAVSDVAGLGIEALGSGSGILDLTRESDDTSLGAELLEEIYTGEGEGGAPAKGEMGEDTRAGLDQAIPSPSQEAAEAVAAEADAITASRTVVVTQTIEYPADAVSSSLTASLVVALAVMWIGGLGAAALVQGVVPGILQTLYANLLYFTAGSAVLAALAAAITYFLAKRK
jgi:hypothetical protein